MDTETCSSSERGLSKNRGALTALLPFSIFHTWFLTLLLVHSVSFGSLQPASVSGWWFQTDKGQRIIRFDFYIRLKGVFFQFLVNRKPST